MGPGIRAGADGSPGFPGLPSLLPPCPGRGSPVCASVCARVFARSRGASAAACRPCVSLAPGLGQSRRWERQLSLSFLSRNEQNKKDFQTCLGRDRMPNGRAPSFFPACYLSCSVVWGEAAPGPPPPAAAGLGGGARSAGAPRGERGAVGIGWGDQDRRERDDWVWCCRGVVAALWVRAGRHRLAVSALPRVPGTWCHPRGGKLLSRCGCGRGALGNRLGCAPSLGTALLSGCSVGRGSGHQRARLGMCTSSYGNHTKKQQPAPPPTPQPWRLLSHRFCLG